MTDRVLCRGTGYTAKTRSCFRRVVEKIVHDDPHRRLTRGCRHTKLGTRRNHRRHPRTGVRKWRISSSRRSGVVYNRRGSARRDIMVARSRRRRVPADPGREAASRDLGEKASDVRTARCACPGMTAPHRRGRSSRATASRRTSVRARSRKPRSSASRRDSMTSSDPRGRDLLASAHADRGKVVNGRPNGIRRRGDHQRIPRHPKEDEWSRSA